jgi:transposase
MATPLPSSLLVGIDWATRAHEVCILDGSRKVLGKRSVANTAIGLEGLVRWLLQSAGGDPHALAVALERPDGPLVETLLDSEIAVYTLNPKQLDRFRDRHCAAGAEDDRRDAFVLADALRTDPHHFRCVTPLEPDLIALRGLVRCDDELRVSENRLGNRFREQLRRYFPQLLDLAADRADPFLWDLWEATPTPAQARMLSPEAVEQHLRHHRIRRLTAAHVLETLRSPAVRVTPSTSEDAVRAITLLLPRLRLTHSQRVACGRQMDELLKALAAAPPPGGKGQHSDAAVLGSLPGVGRAVIARVLTDGAEAIRRRDLSRLRALGGSAPVTKRSGHSCHVLMRRACNPRLRFAFYHWARTAAQRDPRPREHYRRSRSRGHSHGRALRGVVDRLLAVSMAMPRAGTLYRPELRLEGRAGRDRDTAGDAVPVQM